MEHKGSERRSREDQSENLIFGTRAVIEAINAGKEIDKIIIQLLILLYLHFAHQHRLNEQF